MLTFKIKKARLAYFCLLSLTFIFCLAGCSPENQTETLLPMPEFLKDTTLTMQADQYAAVGRDNETYCGFFSKTRTLNNVRHNIVTQRYIDNYGGEKWFVDHGLTLERLSRGKKFVPIQFVRYKVFYGFWVIQSQFYLVLKDEQGVLYKVVTVRVGSASDDVKPYFLCEKNNQKARMLASEDFWPIYPLYDKTRRAIEESR